MYMSNRRSPDVKIDNTDIQQNAKNWLKERKYAIYSVLATLAFFVASCTSNGGGENANNPSGIVLDPTPQAPSALVEETKTPSPFGVQQAESTPTVPIVTPVAHPSAVTPVPTGTQAAP